MKAWLLLLHMLLVIRCSGSASGAGAGHAEQAQQNEYKAYYMLSSVAQQCSRMHLHDVCVVACAVAHWTRVVLAPLWLNA
jgi:hypothetical protein